MYTFSSVLYLFHKFLVLAVRALHINPKPFLYWEADAHRGCYASCFSSHMSTVCSFSDGDQTSILLPVILASGSGQVPAVCVPKSQIVCEVKFEKKTARKKFF